MASQTPIQVVVTADPTQIQLQSHLLAWALLEVAVLVVVTAVVGTALKSFWRWLNRK